MIRLFLLLFSIVILAAEKPQVPAVGEDLVLTNGKSPKEYFTIRAQANVACRKEWDATFLSYQGLNTELKTLLQNKASTSEIDSKEAGMLRVRSKLIDLTNQCGPCAAQPVTTKTILNAGRKEYWYTTDGSCYFPPNDPSLLNSAFEKAVKFLSNTESYARQNGGFDSILEFVPVDRTSGKLLAHNSSVPQDKPFDIFIAIRGPARIAFNYVFEANVHQSETAAGKKEFSILFNGITRPEDFRPEIYDITAGGTKRSILMRRDLTRVQGMWYVNNEGYYRYYTAADFGMSLTFGTGFATTTLLDTVLGLAERGL